MSADILNFPNNRGIQRSVFASDAIASELTDYFKGIAAQCKGVFDNLRRDKSNFSFGISHHFEDNHRRMKYGVSLFTIGAYAHNFPIKVFEIHDNSSDAQRALRIFERQGILNYED